jgi:hypothetical protein
VTKPKTDAVEPWMVIDGDEPNSGFYDEPSFLLPGQLVRWQREQAQLAAEERRREEERAERAHLRQAIALQEARAYTLEKGLAWDPAQPFKHTPSIYQRADAAFAVQDREARAADFRAAQQAGLTHLLHQQGVPSTPEEPVQLEPPGPSGSAARNRVPLIGPSDTTSPAGRARAALRRWSADKRHRNRMEQQ